jgi:hypothetical protein
MPGESEWIKTVILFFDGFGILVPNYVRASPSMQTLRFRYEKEGLLHTLEGARHIGRPNRKFQLI